MNRFQNLYLIVATSLGICLSVFLWQAGLLAHTALIAILAAALFSYSLAAQLLLCEVRDRGADKQKLVAEALHLNAHVKLLLAQAHYDNLTGLGNRNLLADRFHFAVERSQRSKTSFALLMIDLNNFKSVNDNYGHLAGDEVLIASAKRLITAVRASDTVVRLGGDEFLLLVERFEKCEDLLNFGQKLIDSLSEDIALSSGDVVSVGASVGIAQFPRDGFDIGRLIEFADQSMYECKTSGRMPLEMA
jgi:diguanylate cyclase (GGDEF)-like protein